LIILYVFTTQFIADLPIRVIFDMN